MRACARWRKAATGGISADDLKQSVARMTSRPAYASAMPPAGSEGGQTAPA